MSPWHFITFAAVPVAAWLLWSGFIKDRSRGRKRCPRCWYDMRFAAPPCTCPECGRRIGHERELRRTRRKWKRAALGVVLLLIPTVTLAWDCVQQRGWQHYLPTTALIRLRPVVDPPNAGRSPTYTVYMELQSRLESGSTSPEERRQLVESLLPGLDPSIPASQRDETLTLLCKCGLEARPALPAIIRLANDPGQFGYWPFGVLARIDAAASEVWPILENELFDENPNENRCVVILKGLPDRGPILDLAMPALIHLVETDALLGEAGLTLARMGPAAREVLPALRDAACRAQERGWEYETIDAAIEIIEGRTPNLTVFYSRRLYHPVATQRQWAAAMLYNVKREFTPEAVENIRRALHAETDTEALSQIITAIANSPRELSMLRGDLMRLANRPGIDKANAHTARWAIEIIDLR